MQIELEKLPENREYIQLLRIRDKRGNLMRFRFNPAQEYYWRKKTRRNLIIKARQKGLSKVIDADQLIECYRKPIKAVIISHEKDATKRLFASVREFIETADMMPGVSIDSQSEIRFPRVPSSYFIGTAGQKAFGRGDTIGRAHLSEAAHYDNFGRIFGGVSEAAEYGQIDIETTPNGREDIYDMWQKAKAGKSSFTAIFIPWFIDDEYSVEKMTEEEREGLSAAFQELFAIPNVEFMAGLDDNEKRLIVRVKKEWGIELTPGMLKWRRYKIWDKGEMFYQEYPEDDVSCFLQSGRTVFSKITLDITKRIPLDDFENWKAPKERKEELLVKRLYGGLDGAEGTLTGDAHSFAVIEVQESKAYPIFEITSNEPIDIFDLRVAKICRAFNIALGVEKNGVGVAHCQRLKHLGVRFKEWETTSANRPVMITDLEEAYRKEDLIETYPEAENELRDMDYDAKNRAEHKQGKHDDRVFARAIAWQMRKKPAAGVIFI